MSELNDSQRLLAETLNGMIVVDAGPGTGKTHTIVERYINLISQPDVSPNDVLLLTFTNNAASEMEERIKRRLSEGGMSDDAKLVQAKTFDAFCLSVVMDSPEDAGSMFGIEDRLTRGAQISSNDTLNRHHFSTFLDRFLNDRGDNYGDWAAIASQNPVSMLNLINKLMSRGIFPLKKGWFGMDADRQLMGDPEALLDMMIKSNKSGSKGGKSTLAKIVQSMDENTACNLPEVVDGVLPQEALKEAVVDESRKRLLDLIHDVYREYVRKSISEDRLTFGINAMLAFALLYNDPKVRGRNTYRYLIIDEFQDTNANQLMIALMILSHPNLCVVGDWKQGIYGFRFVSIDNIVHFEKRAVEIRRFLNEDTTRVRFSISEVTPLMLDINYRSSESIIDRAFECMYLKGTKNDGSLNVEEVRAMTKVLSAGRTDIMEGMTDIRCVKCSSIEEEAGQVAACIRDYVGSGRYIVADSDGPRPMGLGDIAVLCRKTASCRLVLEKLSEDGIPAFMQGEVEIMSTREGKLALAWLRYVNNERDSWGYVPIMADMGYSMAECLRVARGDSPMPTELVEQRGSLYKKRRRVTEMLSYLFGFYGLDNDITQSIITTLSTAHRNALLTISDLVSIIEDGIREKTLYPVEHSIDRDAVTIMTMHKSKGLEFPAVIIPYMDTNTMPPRTSSHGDVFSFDDTAGVRCIKEVGRYGDYAKVCTSWKSKIVLGSIPSDYSEERRLMFVAMSRAKQYETIICGPKPSQFMEGLTKEYVEIPPMELGPVDNEEITVDRPDLTGYTRRRRKMGVHTIMDFGTEDGMGGMVEGDEIGGKGQEYGTKVHEAAQAVFEGWTVAEEYPELAMIRGIVEKAKRADLAYSEIDCTLPVKECGAVLSGRIDLIAVFDDMVEIHDYKTDVTDRFESEYELQLSVYAYAASQYYSRPAKCFIDYVSMGRTKDFKPIPWEQIVERVEDVIRTENEARPDSA